MPKIDAAGLTLIKSFESLVLYAYDDANDKRIEPGDAVVGTLTIGYGHTGSDVHPGLTITQAQADVLLESDLAGAEKAVNDAVARDCTPNEFAALVSFEFNTGELAESTLLRLFNAGDVTGAAAQFGAWVYDTSISPDPLPGLVRRRDAERALFLAP